MLFRSRLLSLPKINSSKVVGFQEASAPYLREELHYAIDAEFLKSRSCVMARSIAFVPFITVREVDTPTAGSFGSKSAHLLRSSNGMLRGAAAQALHDAKMKKEGQAPAASTTAKDSPPRAKYIQRISPEMFRPKTIVVAMRSHAALNEADVLPCGHSIDPLCQAQLPNSYYSGRLPYGGRFGDGAAVDGRKNVTQRFLGRAAKKFAIPSAPPMNATSQPLLDKEELDDEVDVKSREIQKTGDTPCEDLGQQAAPTPQTVAELTEAQRVLNDHYAVLRSRLDPYNIPNVTKHEGLLRGLFAAAVRASQAEVSEAVKPYAPVLDDEGGGMMVFRNRPRATEDEEEDNSADTLDSNSPFEDHTRAVQQLLAPFESHKRRSANKGRCFNHDLRFYGPPFLLNYFKDENDFIGFLQKCHSAAMQSMTSSEPRYTTDVTLRVPWTFLMGTPLLPSLATRVSAEVVVENALDRVDGEVERRHEQWSAEGKQPSMPNEYILCDTVEEFAMAVSAVWHRLMALDAELRKAMDSNNSIRQQATDTSSPNLKHPTQARIPIPSSLTAARMEENDFFYSYGDGDSDAIRCAILNLKSMDNRTKQHVAKKLGLEEKLDAIHTLSDATPPSESVSVHLLASPYLVFVKDVTAHSLFFACGIPHNGRKVPKLVDTLHLIAPKSEDAKQLLISSETDNHNPLWDAAALGAICTFVLKMRR